MEQTLLWRYVRVKSLTTVLPSKLCLVEHISSSPNRNLKHGRKQRPTRVSNFDALRYVVGVFTNAAGVSHAFTRQRGIFPQIDPPRPTSSEAFGINAQGFIVGSFTDADGSFHGFFDRQGVFTQLDFPGSTSTDGNGINAVGIIVGDFFDSAGVKHGYIAVH